MTSTVSGSMKAAVGGCCVLPTRRTASSCAAKPPTRRCLETLKDRVCEELEQAGVADVDLENSVGH